MVIYPIHKEFTMGRSKRRFETISVVGKSSSTHQSEVGMSVDQPMARDSSEPLSTNAQPIAQDISEPSSTDESTKRRTRGKTTMADVWGLPPDQIIHVECSDTCQPVDDNGQVLSSFLGVVVRTFCPLNYLTWFKVPSGTKLHLVDIIKQKFDYPPEINKWLKKSMAARWRYYKTEIKKKYFHPYESLAFNMKKCPADVHADQWEFLVKFWMSAAGKKIEAANKRSRRRQVVTHTTGNQSYGQKIFKHNKKYGVKVGRIEAFKITHLRKDGTYVNAIVPGILERATAKLLKQSKTSDVDPFKGELEILAQAAGSRNNGRVFGIGIGLTKTDIFGRQASTSFTNHTNEEFDNVKKELAQEKKMRIAHGDKIQEQGDIIQNQGDMIQSLREEMAEMRRMMQLQSNSGPRKHKKSGKRPLDSSYFGHNDYPCNNL